MVGHPLKRVWYMMSVFESNRKKENFKGSACSFLHHSPNSRQHIGILKHGGSEQVVGDLWLLRVFFLPPFSTSLLSPFQLPNTK